MSDPSFLYAPGYPEQGLGGVSRGFTQSPSVTQSPSGGGSAPPSLPYWVNFDAETVGQTPPGWETFGTGTLRAPTVVSNKQIVYDPNRKCLHFNTDATYQSRGLFTMPHAFDVSGGFRAVCWMGYETSNPADGGFYFGNGGSYYTGNGFRTIPYRASPYDMRQYTTLSGTSTLYSTARTVSQFSQWQCFRHEYFPATNQLMTQVLYAGAGTNLFAPSTITMPSGAALTSAFAVGGLQHFAVALPAQANAYYRDAWVLGFWVGRPTDDWPASQGPPTGTWPPSG